MPFYPGPPTFLDSASNFYQKTPNGVMVGQPNMLLVVVVAHEGSDSGGVVPSIDWVSIGGDIQTPRSYTGLGLTKITEQIADTGSAVSSISIWAMANPPLGIHSITAYETYPGAGGGSSITAFVVPDIDLSNGLASAVNAIGGANTTTSGTAINGLINPTIADALIIDCGLSGDPSKVFTSANGQITGRDFNVTSGTGWSGRVGFALSGAPGSRNWGYTVASAAARAAWVGVAFKRLNGALNVGTLKLSVKTAAPGTAWTAIITGLAPGVVPSNPTSSDGTALTINQVNGHYEVTGTFAAEGTPTISITPTLAGATGSGVVQTFPIVVTSSPTIHTIMFTGSSSIEYGFTLAPDEPVNPNSSYWDGAAWQPFTTQGKSFVAFANALLDLLPAGHQVRLLPYGKGGSFLHGSTPGSGWDDTTYTYYQNAKNAALAVGGVDFIISHIGGNDAGGVQSIAVHQGHYDTMLANFRTDLGNPNLRFGIMGTQRDNTNADNDDPASSASAGRTRARAAEMNIADGANCALMSTAVDLALHGDHQHMERSMSRGQDEDYRRVAWSLFNKWLGGTGRYIGPKYSSHTYDAATGWCEITFTVAAGTELVGRTSQEGIQGINFYDHLGDHVPVVPIVAPFISASNKVSAKLPTGLTIAEVRLMEGSSVSTFAQEGARQGADRMNLLFDNGYHPSWPA